MNTGFTEQEFNSMFDDLLDDVVRESVEQERQTYNYETVNSGYIHRIEGLIEDLLSDDEAELVEEESEQETEVLADNGNNVPEHQFTIIMGTSNEDMIERFNNATNQLLLELVEPDEVDAVIFYLLDEQEQERVINHRVARLSYTEMGSMVNEIENMLSERDNHGVSAYDYMAEDITQGIPFVEEGVEEEEPVVEVEPEPVVEVEPEPEVEEPTVRVNIRRVNDYSLAWDIYSLGYASGDIAHVYNLSAGSITRGMKDLGHEMRTGAETRAMRKADPDEFSQGLLDRIFDLLEEKYETEEQRNNAFYDTFNKNIYELTLHEAEDETLELQELQEQAHIQGVSLQDYVRQGLTEEVYEERERSEFVNNVRYLHEYVKDKARELFGDVNVDVGSVDVESKVTYENGVILSVKEAYKLDGKALDATNVVFGVQIAEFIVQGFEREIEELINMMSRIASVRFSNHSQVTRLGNRLVVGLDNE